MFYHGCCCGGLLGGLWHFDCVYELFVDILCICGVVAFEFFSRCVVVVPDVDVSRVVSVAEYLPVFDGGGSAPQRRTCGVGGGSVCLEGGGIVCLEGCGGGGIVCLDGGGGVCLDEGGGYGGIGIS